jgi:hypothetical protein
VTRGGDFGSTAAWAASAGIHVLLGLLVFSFAPYTQPHPATRLTKVVVVRRPPAVENSAPGLKPIDSAQNDLTVESNGGPSALRIPGFTFDFRRIRERATVLFPFLSPGLDFEQFGLAQERQPETPLQNPLASVATGASSAVRRKPALAMSDAALQILIDHAWSRRDRWTSFQRILKFATTYDPDDGKLPTILRTYLQQDGLQPYVDTTIRDPRLWTELGLAADHVKWVGFISRYALAHPSTKATTELLFLLDNLAEASVDALVTVLNVDPASDLRWTADANPDAYRLVLDIRRLYKSLLARRQLASLAALRVYYANVRVAILTAVLQTTPAGYRSSDAQFLIGTIYWRQHRLDAAVDTWRAITIDPTDSYAAAYSDILAAINALPDASVTSERIDRDFARRINGILDAEHGRWVMFSFDRLRRFGYRFDTF